MKPLCLLFWTLGCLIEATVLLIATVLGLIVRPSVIPDMWRESWSSRRQDLREILEQGERKGTEIDKP